MKIYAMFLPQFHEIPENNEWWGDRFTEWVKVKTAKPLFKGHSQPIEPLCGYYNLLEKKTMEWQTELMHKFRIDGFAYYHYYFNGKLLLEKPAENLLIWKDINQPFFFCWANHSWTKAWEKSKIILMEQAYGMEKDWEIHFQYLLKFFRDSRYEKKDNKPIFMIYDNTFPEFEQMFNYFGKRCKESGFAGLYLIERPIPGKEIIHNTLSNNIEVHVHYREPDYSVKSYLVANRYTIRGVRRAISKCLSLLGINSLVEKYYGNSIYEIMLNREYDISDIPGLFFSWDNTPRYRNNGFIIFPPDKTYFIKYMERIKDCQMVLVNAWNEWSEGMILEPTKEHKYEYLEWIKEWKESIYDSRS